ncbi:DUF5658 family protein [Salinigranum salinum]|uniref:DUF5658 family protein n=1 Tax=Salinigranum salinum TaxID=1364937 RepID=UPI001F03AC67|nr:DUF5658 family protein [Salinigranum salinum]
MSPFDLSPTEITDSPTHAHPFVESAETWLWGLVAVSFLLDVGLTSYGLSLGLREANPIARAFFSMLGVVEAMLLLKGTVVGMALVAWMWVPRRYRPIIPLGVALPWLVASTINLGLILQL